MKRKLFSFNLIALLMLSSFVFAKGQSNEKQKVINKNYSVNAGDKLNIENQFGKVVVETWEKNEISVEITLKASAKSEAKSLELLEGIKINETKAGGAVYLKTQLPNNVYNTGKQSMTVDYTVKMPANSPLALTNKFGNVYMGVFKANLQLNVSYGSIRIQKLQGDNKRINVSFGSADIDELDEADIESKYSKLNIEKLQNAEIRNQFGKTYINEANVLRITQKYGDLDLRKVNTIIGTIEFANIDVDALGKSAELNLKYSGNADLGVIGAGVDLIKINAGFSTVYMKFSESNAFDFSARLKFGDLKLNNQRIDNFVKTNNETTHEKEYKGKVGNGGKGNLILDGNYTTIYFQ